MEHLAHPFYLLPGFNLLMWAPDAFLLRRLLWAPSKSFSKPSVEFLYLEPFSGKILLRRTSHKQKSIAAVISSSCPHRCWPKATEFDLPFELQDVPYSRSIKFASTCISAPPVRQRKSIDYHGAGNNQIFLLSTILSTAVMLPQQCV